MTRKLIGVIVLISACGITACSKASNEQTDTVKNHSQNAKTELSASDKEILDKYESTTNEVVISGEDEKIKQTLVPLIPEIKQVIAKKQREMALMNIYMLSGMYKEAYELNEQQIKENPLPQRILFRCTLLEKLNDAKVKIQQCHEASAKLIQTELAKASSKDNPQYKDAEFVYLTEMYKAGHTDYKAKIQSFINETIDVVAKDRYKSLYDAEIESFYGTDSADYVPESLKSQ
ncbi:hypothetical protein [Acinetobacter haemolyticus]|uniref:hypothetical protein n=1 Tax=Acinetobacter haemolyticus TaxID=29430 RepID=UPI0013730805|nr:hypothetical protein [Acinetobacter haemolyticus]NAR29484.1 hypothetical protein [Acinetobacter haemolyticus]NAR75700.1 hypothetical protein [Acinetobacter haemolyticus]